MKQRYRQLLLALGVTTIFIAIINLPTVFTVMYVVSVPLTALIISVIWALTNTKKTFVEFFKWLVLEDSEGLYGFAAANLIICIFTTMLTMLCMKHYGLAESALYTFLQSPLKDHIQWLI